ncbi:hypothetical protein Hypma_013314 [Hypsizygus marmoreus]|uniref:Uncharacterized protein n=1 Tax=Hypsizygus marmoreus TaxID=39966 RepID=A0A369JC28_HYPMA|nr:hypothetical protein Hypma_013314 [Hypsizygus marmoreus]
MQFKFISFFVIASFISLPASTVAHPTTVYRRDAEPTPIPIEQRATGAVCTDYSRQGGRPPTGSASSWCFQNAGTGWKNSGGRCLPALPALFDHGRGTCYFSSKKWTPPLYSTGA